jgi:shikimate dehydrogenase
MRILMPNELSGASRLFPIIGDPIAYVESPKRFSRTLSDREFDGICIPMRVSPDALDDVMRALSATSNVDGVLVTMPHKFNVFSHCASVSERARTLAAISVMRRNADRSWHGDTLDGLAFVEAQRRRGAQIEGRKALLVGAGGAGRAIALALVEAGIGEIVVHDADESRTTGLIDLMTKTGEQRIRAGLPDPSQCTLVFNATSMGMNLDDPPPIDLALLDSSMFVGDVIAGHGVTPLIRAALDAGCKVADGDEMVDAVQTLMADFMLSENNESTRE